MRLPGVEVYRGGRGAGGVNVKRGGIFIDTRQKYLRAPPQPGHPVRCVRAAAAATAPAAPPLRVTALVVASGQLFAPAAVASCTQIAQRAGCPARKRLTQARVRPAP
eukprot:437980-Prymnesium_polylepis.1